MNEETFGNDAAAGLIAHGQALLRADVVLDEPLAALRERLRASPVDGYRTLDQAAAWLVCVLAWRAVCRGSFGVGAVLLDERGGVIEAGGNEAFSPHFRSEAHAEMVVLTAFETHWPNRPRRQLRLFTSLESCPMCRVRALGAGIGEVVHLVGGAATGTGSMADELPPFWREKAAGVRFREGVADEGLRRLALEIFHVNVETLSRRIEALG